MFWLFTSKQLNGVTLTMYNRYAQMCFGGLELTHQTAVPEIPGSILVPGEDYDVCFFLFDVIKFNFLVPNQYFILL